ncbi:cholecystokinin receptor-like [Mytilus californianus]|uniref:cholecystokinin receptor-like n=1 Tax=Mytilus californianus TaxID=6549 RepID=UPI002247D4F6|nr:cholecystokinin receptor-like [Mytilus californianus]
MENNGSNSNAVSVWNSKLSKILIPNNIVLSLYIFLGIIGNTTVIIVYRFRMRKKSEDRYFIPILAVSDLAGATVCGSFGIALNMMQSEFYNKHLCKAWWFFAAFTTYMSILLLLIIATQRYLKLCRPQGHQMKQFHKRLAVGLSLGLASLLALPTTALYGSVDFPNADGSVVGARCSKLKEVNKTLSLLYGVIIIIILLTSMTIMIFFYSRIGHKVYIHFKYKKSSHSSGKEQISSNIDTEMQTITSVIVSDEHVTENKESKPEIEKYEPEGITPKTKSKVKHSTGSPDINRRLVHKFTIMFMMITIVFLICYIPKVILIVVEGLDPYFWQNFSDNERTGILFIYRMYIINNVVNPFIYAFMDLDFRKETKKLFRYNDVASCLK